MNIQEANFQDLIAYYYEKSPARKARDIVRRKQHFPFADLLRFYREHGILCPDEIDIRSPIDALLNCSGILEMAMLAGFIRPPDDSGFWKEMKEVLENPEIKEYYTKFYPTKLPQLLLMRLQNQYQFTRIENGDVILPAFMRFLELDMRFTEKLNEGCFLQMLDGFRINDLSYSDFIESLREPKEFVERIKMVPEETEILDEVSSEFTIFMKFCFDFHELLNELIYHPLIQSEIWNHYSYWFGYNGKQVEQKIRESLDQFLTWRPNEMSHENSLDMKRYVAEGKVTLKTLTSNVYSGPVDEILSCEVPNELLF